jgi:hypothetical protein
VLLADGLVEQERPWADPLRHDGRIRTSGSAPRGRTLRVAVSLAAGDHDLASTGVTQTAAPLDLSGDGLLEVVTAR